ncbi:MAG: PrsW family glutamic-type intramembrane protease [Candidatus Staskawiczbacteria bacterium]|nr:PrsW family glutamic-type intramembrane protease [Candidatus Staskawiczbacteria bacterium]
MNSLRIDSDFFLKIAANFILISAFGLILPMILIFVVHFTGYSEIFEEIVKMLVILFLVLKLPDFKLQIIGAVIFGFLFGLSESMLYLNNIFQIGDFSVFWQRFLFAVPMHIITVLVILFSGKMGKKFIIFGLAISIILHLLFNGLISIF